MTAKTIIVAICEYAKYEGSEIRFRAKLHSANVTPHGDKCMQEGRNVQLGIIFFLLLVFQLPN